MLFTLIYAIHAYMILIETSSVIRRGLGFEVKFGLVFYKSILNVMDSWFRINISFFDHGLIVMKRHIN